MAKKSFSLIDSLNATKSAAPEQTVATTAPAVVTDNTTAIEKKVRGPYNSKKKKENESAVKSNMGRRGPKESTIMDGSRAERNFFLKCAVTPETGNKIKIYSLSNNLSVEELIYLAIGEYFEKHK